MNWPRTSLKRFTDRMQDRDTINLIDLLRQWRTLLAKKAKSVVSRPRRPRKRIPQGAGITNALEDRRRPCRGQRTKTRRWTTRRRTTSTIWGAAQT